jgi:DNA-binding IclR family transcriptional regulator
VGALAVSEKQTVQSVERAFQILDTLRENGGGMGIRNIAREVELNTTTTHRLLKTLSKLGVVQQNPQNRSYQLAPKIILYGKAVLDSYDFIKVAHPFLGELSKSVGETVFMGIHDSFELVYIDHVDSLDHVLRITPQIGRRQPLHCTALGKVLLSHMRSDQLQAFLENKDLVRLTENTISDPGDLQSELEKVRNQGYAVDLEETEIGICCVAAPVKHVDGHVVAAVSVSGPATRMKKKGLSDYMKDEVIATAMRISRTVIT